jgi:hypothetical protein
LHNNRRKEQRETGKHCSTYEEYDKEYDDMRGTGRTYDFFESEFVNRFDGWSIPFQTVHDDAEHSSRGQHVQSGIQTERLTLSGSQIKTWNRVVLRGQRSNLGGPREMKTILPVEVDDDRKEILK